MAQFEIRKHVVGQWAINAMKRFFESSASGQYNTKNPEFDKFFTFFYMTEAGYGMTRDNPVIVELMETIREIHNKAMQKRCGYWVAQEEVGDFLEQWAREAVEQEEDDHDTYGDERGRLDAEYRNAVLFGDERDFWGDRERSGIVYL